MVREDRRAASAVQLRAHAKTANRGPAARASLSTEPKRAVGLRATRLQVCGAMWTCVRTT
jgi:hypothetical protein